MDAIQEKGVGYREKKKEKEKKEGERGKRKEEEKREEVEWARRSKHFVFPYPLFFL